MSPVNGTYPSDHYRKSGDSAQSLGSSTISSHQLEKTVSQVDGSDVTGKSEFERKLDSRFDQLIADLRNHLVSYWAGCHKFATQHETHESINKIKSPVSPVRGTNPSEKGNHYRKSGDSAQPLVSANISSHQVEKTVSQVAAMSQENRQIYHIIPTIVNLLITHLMFRMKPTTHWNWKLQIWINQFQSRCPWKILPRSDHTGVRSHVIRWKVLVFIAGSMVILLMSALMCVHPVGLIKTQTGGTQWSSEMYTSPKLATGISISLQYRIALTNIMYLQFKTI